jgi:xylulokinase
VICGLLDGLDELSRHADTSGRVLLVGGGAHSLAYRQVLADLTGREIITSDIDQAVAMGACVQAAATLLGRDPAELRSDWLIGTEQVTIPDSAAARRREEVRSRYAQLRDS